MRGLKAQVKDAFVKKKMVQKCWYLGISKIMFYETKSFWMINDKMSESEPKDAFVLISESASQERVKKHGCSRPYKMHVYKKKGAKMDIQRGDASFHFML